MLKKLERIIPAYAWLPLFGIVAINLIAYYGTRLVTADAVRMDLSLPLDASIPFCARFIVFYIAAYLQWFFGFILIGRESREVCYRFLSAQSVAKLICLAMFLLLPTQMTRPEVAGNDVFSRLTRLIYSIDAPINLFPSIHCLDSWMCFRGGMKLKRTPRWYAPFTLVLTVLVIASTVLVKQHVVVDILGGILAAEAGLLISRALRLERLYARFERCAEGRKAR